MSTIRIEAIEVDKTAMLPIKERSEWHCCFCAKCGGLDEPCKEHECSEDSDCNGCESCAKEVKIDCDNYDDEQDYRESEADDEEQ